MGGKEVINQSYQTGEWLANRHPARRSFGCEFGYNMSSELRGYHPCVIMQNNTTAMNLRMVFVAPITHASTRTNKPDSLVPATQQKDSVMKNRYTAKAYDSLRIIVPNRQKAIVEAHAKSMGESINGMVNRAILADMGLTEWPETQLDSETEA